MSIDLSKVTKKYTNGTVTVVWKPGMCIHSRICYNGLPNVFDPTKRPWVNINGDNTDRIIEQVRLCPSGALSYFMNNGNESTSEDDTIAETVIEAKRAGPLFVYGNITVKKSDGTTEKKTTVTAFCRCGNSGNKPYCDGSHVKAGFEG
jgi:uncharacterized Fe-S cluster protein YjdI